MSLKPHDLRFAASNSALPLPLASHQSCGGLCQVQSLVQLHVYFAELTYVSIIGWKACEAPEDIRCRTRDLESCNKLAHVF